MRHRYPLAYLVIAAVLLLVSAALLVTIIAYFLDWQFNGVSAAAQVTRVSELPSRHGPRFAVDFTYATPTGGLFEGREVIGQRRNVGSTMAIIYHRDDPASHRLPGEQGELIIGVGGAVATGLSILLLSDAWRKLPRYARHRLRWR